MDLNISIVGDKIETSLYCKPLALHLYIPPHSAHSPGNTTGLIMGMVLRIYQLNSRPEHRERDLVNFFIHLLDRGYHQEHIRPLFQKAIDNAIAYLSQSQAYREKSKAKKEEQSKRRIFLHLPYHPGDPPSSKIQQLWRRTLYHPRGGRPLNCLTSRDKALIPIDQMVIAYSRAPNLGNILSYRKICSRSGPKVSSYLWLDVIRPLLFFELQTGPAWRQGLPEAQKITKKDKKTIFFTPGENLFSFCFFHIHMKKSLVWRNWWVRP